MVSCASHERVSLSAPARAYEPRDYSAVLERWTRSSRLNSLSEMDNVLTVTSTYYSPEFRAAYLARYVNDFHASPEVAGQLRAEHQRLGESQHEFYVALFGQRHEYGRLDDAEKTAWQVHLIDDRGHAYAPTRVERIARPTVLERTYFPYTTDFRSVFRVIFSKHTQGDMSVPSPAAAAPPLASPPEPPVVPAQPGAVLDENARWFGLRFSGPQGTTILKWYLG